LTRQVVKSLEEWDGSNQSPERLVVLLKVEHGGRLLVVSIMKLVPEEAPVVFERIEAESRQEQILMVHIWHWLSCDMLEHFFHVAIVIICQTSIIGQWHQDAAPQHRNQIFSTLLRERLFKTDIVLAGRIKALGLFQADCLDQSNLS